MDYNGWSNRATWLVNLWFSPESKEDVERAKETIEEAVDQIPDFLRDFLCTDEINWKELECHFYDDEDDEDA